MWWRATGALVPEGFDLHHKDDVGLNNDFDNLELLPHGCAVCKKYKAGRALARKAKLADTKT